MQKQQHTRRGFLKRSAGAAAAGVFVPYFVSNSPVAAESRFAAASDRPTVGFIGTGSRGMHVGLSLKPFADVIAVCDVDSRHGEEAKQRMTGGEGDYYKDYRKILERDDIDCVFIVTPDHWHTKIAIEAMQAGKDVYCEKPLTLTVDEGKLICQVAKETGRVFQVGTQQRSEMDGRFLKAVALCREGRLGKINKIDVSIGMPDVGGPFASKEPPQELDWDMWLGQAPMTPYIPERCHYQFRWWYEYSGGKMTDWGAHHVDIAHWALGADDTGPVSYSGTAKHPEVEDGYNTAYEFNVNSKFADGTELIIRHDGDNGLLIEGDKGRIFVSRGSLKGAPVEELADNPLPEDAITKLYKGKVPGNHARNFFECVKTRDLPISDVFSHHRAISTCHLANICIRLGRGFEWDPVAEQIVGDDDANTWLSREQRAGYEITI